MFSMGYGVLQIPIRRDPQEMLPIAMLVAIALAIYVSVCRGDPRAVFLPFTYRRFWLFFSLVRREIACFPSFFSVLTAKNCAAADGLHA